VEPVGFWALPVVRLKRLRKKSDESQVKRSRYFNHPRLRKYHIGTRALPIIRATV